jgi:pimeloyl-ACP methyl ester carboxylesterase
VAPDLLGHGMTPESNSYQIEDFVANMLPRVADRDIELLIGHSLGGPVSLGLYPNLKTKPKRFVLVDPVSHPLPVSTCR